MKRKLVMLLCLGALLACGAQAAGNVELYAPPALALTADAGTPVTVERAALTLDFSAGKKDELGLSPQAQLTAAYTVFNPTDEARTITVAAPFAGAIGEQDSWKPEVTVDGEAADAALYYGGLWSATDPSALGSGEALSAAVAACPQELPDGTMYTFVPVVDLERFQREESRDRFYVRVKFRCDQPLIYGGFGGINTLEDGSLELTVWIYPERTQWPLLTVFLPGGGTLEDCEVNGYDDYNTASTPLGVEMTWGAEEAVPFRDYMEQYMDTEGQALEQSYWAILTDMELNEDGLPVQAVQEAGELARYAQDYDRLGMAVVQVALAPGQSREITVTGALSGTVERSETGEEGAGTSYTYTWLSAPARAWADFGGVELTVIPPKHMDFSAAGFDATRQTNGSYTANWDGLPEGEVVFTLSPAPAAATPAWLLPAALGGAVAVIAAVAAALLLRRKK